MNSILAYTIVFLLIASGILAALAGVFSVVTDLVKALRRAGIERELEGDWWPRFEHDLSEYESLRRTRPRHYGRNE
jgi:hypothetical protein